MYLCMPASVFFVASTSRYRLRWHFDLGGFVLGGIMSGKGFDEWVFSHGAHVWTLRTTVLTLCVGTLSLITSSKLFIPLGTSLFVPQIQHLLTLCAFINFICLLTYLLCAAAFPTLSAADRTSTWCLMVADSRYSSHSGCRVCNCAGCTNFLLRLWISVGVCICGVYAQKYGSVYWLCFAVILTGVQR